MNQTPKHIIEKIEYAKKNQVKVLDLSPRWDACDTEKLTKVPDQVLELEHLQVLKLNNNQLTSIPNSIGLLQNLNDLDLSNNKLTRFPDSIIKLENLTHLYLSNNDITQLPDWIAIFKDLTLLDLSHNQLMLIPDSISRLQKLTQLYLSNNHLLLIPELIEKLRKLTYLDLRNNELTKVPDSISKLKDLILLGLSNNKLKKLPDLIGNLKSLTYLDVIFNQLTKLPSSISKLKNLTILSLSSNKLTDIPDSISKLKNLYYLDLDDNQLTSLPDSISKLKKLIKLKLSFNKFSQIPDSISKLESLNSLDLEANQLNSLPDSIAKLKDLTQLILSNNLFTQIPDVIFNLSSLKELLFSNNNITQIDPKIVQLKNLKELNFKNNPINTPAIEIVQKGIPAMDAYFYQINVKGKEHLYNANLIIIGDLGAGKTTLLKKLLNQDYKPKNKDLTQGIDAVKWQFLMENNQEFNVNIWDFVGDATYSTISQFFLAKRSLYVLVIDTNTKETDLYYWLNTVQILTNNSPLLIVKNEKQDRPLEINQLQLQKEFTNFKTALSANFATNKNVDTVISGIKHYLTNMTHVNTPFPKTWVDIINKLENDPRAYISYDEFVSICGQNGFTDQANKLANLLHDLGFCLHFHQDIFLKDIMILKPEWILQAIYSILNNATLLNNFGKFNSFDLTKIWDDEKYADMKDIIVQIMIYLKLCYKLVETHDDTYIIPKLLSKTKPEYEWDENNNTILKYRYEFMPQDIILKFIANMHDLILDQKLVWQTGVILKKDDATAQVLGSYGMREIEIRVIGNNGLMSVIVNAFDKIHNFYQFLKYKKLIPCYCSTCAKSKTPYFYDFNILQKFAINRKKIQCQKNGQMLDPSILIDDVLAQKKIEKRIEEHSSVINLV